VSARNLASVDGRISPTEQAVLPLPDDGLYRGDGAFEVIRLYAGRPFALADHLDRIERSSQAIDLPVDRAAVEQEIGPLLAESGDADAQLRIVLTRGGRRILLIEPLAEKPASVTVATVTYSPTAILDKVKSLSYAANMHATRIAQSRGADEAVFVTPDDVVLEPPTSSIFWVDAGGVLRTPSLELPILDSITRSRLLSVVDAEEGSYSADDLRSATEVFLASTTREIQPVSAVDGVEPPGPAARTMECAEAFAALVERELASAPSR
jgi:branched-chain amino acid aminotransferase